jgi:hypothetical protein
MSKTICTSEQMHMILLIMPQIDIVLLMMTLVHMVLQYMHIVLLMMILVHMFYS